MRDISNEWMAVLLDPFGVRAYGRMVRYFSTAESNTILPALNSYLLVNRICGQGIALVFFGLTVWLFKPQRAGTGRRLFGKAQASAKKRQPLNW